MTTEQITPMNWQTNFKGRLKEDSIDDDFVLFEDVNIMPTFHYPFKVDVTTFIISLKGETRGKIGVKSYATKAPCITTLLAGEILQYEYISDDFSGLFMLISKQLSDDLLPNFRERLPIHRSVQENPSIPLSRDDLELLKIYYNMLKKVVGMKENPRRKEIVRLLLQAFYYLSSSQFHNVSPKQESSKHESLVKRFLDLVGAHYKEQRQVGFYADKLCFTPKYLSRIIKANTGKSADEWIDEFVILEAKALLKSGNMTIQQISDELNFSNQSFFGKYFKRHESISPSEYRIR